MDIEITDAEIEKIILKREKKKEYQRVYDANKYQQIKEKRLADNKKYYKEKINNIETKYKVIDYKDIDLEEFTKKYIIGSRCSKSKIKENKYCKLHANHLIHGDYFEIPSKELCYHFIKDGKYL